MKKNTSSVVEGSHDEITALVRQLQAIQKRLHELTDGQVDAVVQPDGQFFLLHEAQEKLRRSEEALRTSEGNMATAQRIAHIGSWELELSNLDDVYANRLSWSDEMFRILGYEPGEVEVSNELFFRHVPEEDHEPIRQKVAAALGEHQHYSIVHRLRRANGEERLVQEEAEIFFDEKTGQALRMVGTTHDITEQHRMGEATLESETKFRTLFDVASDAMFTLHRGVFVDCNAKGLELFGVTRDRLIGQSPSLFSPPTQPDGRDSHEKFTEILQRVLAGEPQFFEWKQQRADGTAVYVDVSLSRFDLRGEPYIQSVARDITERRRTESRFRRLVDSNAQGMFFWNTKGEIIEANDAVLNLICYTREDLKAGRINWVALTPPEYASLDQRALQQIAAKGTCEPYEKEFIRKDGSRVPILLGAASFDNSTDEGVCFTVDLTERKKLEQQVFRAQRMDSIGTLAGGIAHDLNNILAPIMMSIAILQRTTDTPQTREILKTIEVSAKRGADIVRQVLSFARGVEGERVEIQPGHLLKDLEHIIKDTFPKDIRLQFSVPSDTWTVLCDPTQIHQVLLNLCVNARDAMPNGGSLAVDVANCEFDEQYAAMNLQARPGRYVNISVTDSGTGIPRGILDKIFEPFFTTKELHKGTGLGLSTVQAIVKRHGGIVNVYSEPGKGTTFKVYLPAVETTQAGQTKQTQRVSLPRGNGETILLVDDEASILTITGQTLQAFGYRVLTATDGAEATVVYAQNKKDISVIVTDMMMPIMDGASVILALLKINPSAKIIAASGLNANDGRSEASFAGIKHFLLKPYTAGSLLKTVRASLDEP